MRSSRITLLLCLSCVLVACGLGRMTSGVAESFTTEADLAKRGAETHAQIMARVALYDDPTIAAYVTRVGERVSRATGSTAGSHRFYVLDDPEANAFAVPGGFIYINRGLLTLLSSEDELAAVLGHEVGHLHSGHASAQARARGGMNILTGAGQFAAATVGMLTFNPFLTFGSVYGGPVVGDPLMDALSSGYGRQQEYEADRVGAAAAATAGYSPQSAVLAIAKLQNEAALVEAILKARGLEVPPQHGIFASHPDNVQRLQAVKAQAATLKALPAKPQGDYLAQIAAMPYGVPERMGVQRGRQFYDGVHQQVMTVPPGWFVNQSLSIRTVAFTAPQSAAVILFNSQPIEPDFSVESFVKIYLGGATVRGSVRRQQGREQWRGTAEIRDLRYEVTGWIGRDAKGDTGYLLLGLLAKPADAAKAKSAPKIQVQWPAEYERFSSQQRAMRADEHALAAPPVVRLKTADGGDTYAQLASTAALGQNGEGVLRLINGQYPSGEPAKGQRLKLVQ